MKSQPIPRAISSTKSAATCSGKKDSNNKTIYNYGIKNFNPNVNKNVVMNATMSAGSVLYAPTSSPSNVFVFDKVTVGTNVSYTVYRLV